jgi:hypothetical protein
MPFTVELTTISFLITPFRVQSYSPIDLLKTISMDLSIKAHATFLGIFFDLKLEYSYDSFFK